MQQSKRLFQKAKQNRHLDRQSAKYNYEKCIQLNPKDEKAYFILGNIFRQEGQLQVAVKNYKKVIQLNPNYYKAYLNLGLIYEDLQKFEDAVLYYKKVIQISPTYQKAYYNLGNLYQVLGRYQLAIKNFKKVVEINPSDQEALYKLGLCYQQLKQHQNQKISFKKAIQVSLMNKISSKKPYEKLITNEKEEKIKQFQNTYEEYYRYCIICCVKQKNCACIPCGHMNMCFECGVLVKECPICKRQMTPQRIYL